MNDPRLSLPHVTLCAVTSVNVAATLRALEACVDQIAFAKCLLLTDASVQAEHTEIDIVPIRPLRSSAAYSAFLLSEMVDHVTTSHCLVAQWDGHVVDAQRWRPEFLKYDYIGASWPQFGDGHDVGNGGFSLRSRRLMELCRSPNFVPSHPEDVAIGRTNRGWLEGHGMRFAPKDLADLFAAERTGDPQCTFGYHGVWNMPRAIGTDAFWDVYRSLDDRGTVWTDFKNVARSLAKERKPIERVGRLIFDRATHFICQRFARYWNMFVRSSR